MRDSRSLSEEEIKCPLKTVAKILEEFMSLASKEIDVIAKRIQFEWLWNNYGMVSDGFGHHKQQHTLPHYQERESVSCQGTSGLTVPPRN